MIAYHFSVKLRPLFKPTGVARKVLYFAKSGQSIKIGFSKNPKKRCSNFGIKLPEAVELLGVMEGELEDEMFLHRRFKEHRLQGEWFRDCEAIRSFIAKYCNLTEEPKGSAQNKGKPVGQKKAFTREEVALIDQLLVREAATNPIALRDRAMLRLGVDTMLRSSDLRKLTVGDLTEDGKDIRPSFVIMQTKTNQPIKCNLLPMTQQAVSDWILSGWGTLLLDDRLFDISDRHHRRIIKGWAKSIKLDPKLYSTHSIRRTKSREIYRKTRNLEAVRRLLGHSSVTHTLVYLGVEQEDADAIAREVEI